MITRINRRRSIVIVFIVLLVIIATIKFYRTKAAFNLYRSQSSYRHPEGLTGDGETKNHPKLMKPKNQLTKARNVNNKPREMRKGEAKSAIKLTRFQFSDRYRKVSTKYNRTQIPTPSLTTLGIETERLGLAYLNQTARTTYKPESKNLHKYCASKFNESMKLPKQYPFRRPPWYDLIKEQTPNSTNSTPPLYVGGHPTGRLGNNLFEYVALFNIAWENKRIPLWFGAKDGLHSIFKLRIPVARRQDYAKVKFLKIPDSYTSPSVEFLPLTKALPPQKNVFIEGYIQKFKHYALNEDQLRYDLTFLPHVKSQAERRLIEMSKSLPSSWHKLGFVRVVIHVRRTDFMNHRAFYAPKPDYFKKAMAYFTDCLPRVQFIVISDDIAWSRKHIIGETVAFSDSNTTPGVDMAIASLCDHAILTCGSFGSWVSWFANGITVRQSRKQNAVIYVSSQMRRTA